MSDGANLGIRAGRALASIIGGKKQPSADERSTPEETRARLMAAPLFEGKRPWEDVEWQEATAEERDEAYSAAADSVAHAFLVLIEEDRSLLEPRFYPETYPDGEPMPEWAAGKPRDQADVLWDAMKERWPHADEWVGGASGFMVGFALNAAIYALGENYMFQNPAIVELEISS